MSAEGAKNVSWPWLSPLQGWGILTMTFNDKFVYVVKNDVVKKTDYNAKVTSIESQIAGVTKNALDNLGDITKLKAVDTSNFVLKTEL